MKKSQLRKIIRSVIREHITNPNDGHLNNASQPHPIPPKYRCGHCDEPCPQQVIDNNTLLNTNQLQIMIPWSSGNSICMYNSPQECRDGCEEPSGFGASMKRCYYDKFGKPRNTTLNPFGNPIGCKTCTDYEANYHPNFRYNPTLGEIDPFIRCTPSNHLHNGIYGCQCADSKPNLLAPKGKTK